VLPRLLSVPYLHRRCMTIWLSSRPSHCTRGRPTSMMRDPCADPCADVFMKSTDPTGPAPPTHAHSHVEYHDRCVLLHKRPKLRQTSPAAASASRTADIESDRTLVSLRSHFRPAPTFRAAGLLPLHPWTMTPRHRGGVPRLLAFRRWVAGCARG